MSGENQAAWDLYHKLDRALDVVRHEGNEPWYDLYYYMILWARGQRTPSSPLRRGQWLESGKKTLSNHAPEQLLQQLQSHQIMGDAGIENLFRVLMGLRNYRDAKADPLALCYNVLNKVETRNQEGVFFTPPSVAQFAAEHLHIMPFDSVIDPACGTGVFLTEASISIRLSYPQQTRSTFHKNYQRLFERASRIDYEKNLWGIEKDPILCALSRSSDHGTILFGDALDRTFPGIQESTFDVVFLNPPFGVKVEDEVANDYDLASTPVGSRSETLFIERAIRLARPKTGRIAMILSEEVFENPKYADVLEYIREHTRPVAEYFLPRSTFEMSETDVKTRLLILWKTDDRELEFSPISLKVERMPIVMEKDHKPTAIRINELGKTIFSQNLMTMAFNVGFRKALPLKVDSDFAWGPILGYLRALRELCDSGPAPEYDRNGKIFSLCTEGAIRDFVMDLFGLRLFDGLEGDVAELLRDVSGDTPEEVNHEAFLVAKGEIERQVKKGNTFFLDPTKMADIPELGPLVADILDIRKKQILRLEENPPLVDVYSTYYGFTLLTRGSIDVDTAGVADPALEHFTQLAKQIGKDLQLNHSQLKYSKSAFGRVSEHTRELLWNILSVCASGVNNRMKAIKRLGELRDSRALDILHLKLLNTNDRRTVREIIQALKIINHPSTLEVLKRLNLEDHDYALKNVVRGLIHSLSQESTARY